MSARLEFVDFVRGLAIIGVVLFHLVWDFGIYRLPDWNCIAPGMAFVWANSCWNIHVTCRCELGSRSPQSNKMDRLLAETCSDSCCGSNHHHFDKDRISSELYFLWHTAFDCGLELGGNSFCEIPFLGVPDYGRGNIDIASAHQFSNFRFPVASLDWPICKPACQL